MHFLRSGFTLLLVFASWQTACLESAERPNLILIMSDDMGYSDLGCYGGGEAKTPNLDSLAKNGLRFTQFYNTARCCPTRASLLTGLYPHQAGIGHMTDDKGYDGYRGDLNRQCVTIAEVLKPAGYRTYMTGKWHVTKSTGPNGSQANWPLQRGFEKYYGTLVGGGNFFNPSGLCRQNTLITCETDPDYQPEQFYYTDAISDNSVAFLKQHQHESPDKPFFLYVAYTAAHWPMHALEKDIAKYKGLFDQGYAPRREARLARMKDLGLISAETALSPQAEHWSQVKNKAWEARCMEVYCAMIDNMDAGIGRIRDQLQASGQLENTLILFLQDNGACAETVGRLVSEIRQGNSVDGKPLRSGPDVMPGPGDTFVAYGRGWANVSNTPFREYKHWVHEGGISTPLIAHWPAGIPAARAGQLERQPAHLIDLMATCVDLAEASYPTEFAGNAIKPREGVSLRPAFLGESLQRSQPIYWEHEGNKAIRDGRWKLVAKEDQPWELYDIDVDRVEANNLAESHPEIVKTLSAQWETYAQRANVLPLRKQHRRGRANAADRKTQRFVLSPGDELVGAKAPSLVDRGFTIQADIEVTKPTENGVILSQGGSRFGFALSLKNGQPVFAVRTREGLTQIEGAEKLTGSHRLIAQLDTSGKLTLKTDGQPAAQEVAGKLIGDQPQEGLMVGRDEAGAVGDYQTSNPFHGTIKSLILEMHPAPAN